MIVLQLLSSIGVIHTNRSRRDIKIIVIWSLFN